MPRGASSVLAPADFRCVSILSHHSLTPSRYWALLQALGERGGQTCFQTMRDHGGPEECRLVCLFNLKKKKLHCYRTKSKKQAPGPGPVPDSIILLTCFIMLSQYGTLLYCLATEIIEKIRSERLMTISRILKGDTVESRMTKLRADSPLNLYWVPNNNQLTGTEHFVSEALFQVLYFHSHIYSSQQP